MNQRQRKRQEKDLLKNKSYAQLKEEKLAAKARRGTRNEKGNARPKVTEDNWDELFGGTPLTRPSAALSRRERAAQSAGEGRDEHGDHGIVISVSSKRCRVFYDGREIDCLVPPDIAVRQKSALAVGDRVTIVSSSSEGEVWRVTGVLPRRSVLARPDPQNKHLQRLIAANIDVVIHVVSVKAPPLRPRLIDRYFIAIQRGGAQPVLCVNKVDLLDPQERAEQLALLETYRQLSVPVIPCSAKSGEGIDELRSEVQGKTAALVGHSGVGKSSILNALDSRLELATKDLHRRGTGRHTTTASTLYDFGDGTYLIDTPGIREFGLWDLDRGSLRDYFPEFAEPSEFCRFNDCSHIHEPSCDVKDRALRGELNRARYETYVRLYHDLE